MIERAQLGFVDAYEELVRRHRRAAVQVAYLVSGSRAEAEDIAQDAFVRAYMALPRFRRGARFRPWLFAIVANLARNARRSAGRRNRLVLEFEHHPSGPDEPGPETRVLAGENQRRLMAAVNALPDGARLVVALRYFADLSVAEVAAALGLRPGTVKSRLARAHERLRQALAEPPEVRSAEGASHA
ncbi:MAG: RNA polymerase sigma factor [Actinobacteria bacterium]|nr:RNA polymerase sigma factor [Actinomycetota bacterium]